jgi:hypothetical protein
MTTKEELLLKRLRASPTDLRKLVEAVLRRDCPVVAIPARAIDRWQRDDSASWRFVLDWLVSRGTRIVLVDPPTRVNFQTPVALSTRGPPEC